MSRNITPKPVRPTTKSNVQTLTPGLVIFAVVVVAVVVALLLAVYFKAKPYVDNYRPGPSAGRNWGSPVVEPLGRNWG